MKAIAPEVLIESKTARDSQLAQIDHKQASDALNKVKTLYFALWQGVGSATTEQMAEFYEVSEGTIRPLVKAYKEELELDGLKTLRGSTLKDASCELQLASKTSQLTIWTPRAALRLGMILRDSEVAKAVRTSLLDAAESVASLAEEIAQLRTQIEVLTNALASQQQQPAKVLYLPPKLTIDDYINSETDEQRTQRIKRERLELMAWMGRGESRNSQECCDD